MALLGGAATEVMILSSVLDSQLFYEFTNTVIPFVSGTVHKPYFKHKQLA